MRIITASADLEEFSRDAGIVEIRPDVAYVAEAEVDVVDALRLEAATGRSVTARGGGTSIPSQSVGRGAILLQRRTGVRLLAGGLAACEPGVVKAELNTRLAAGGGWMPVDPSSYASCTVGGMVANNSSGVRQPKYGSTIDYVLEMRAVVPGEEARPVRPMPLEAALSSGPRTRRVASLLVENGDEISKEAPKVTKNSSGYRLERVVHDGAFDLPKLLVGSEGTLGVFTEVTFTTIPRPVWRVLFVVETSLEGLNEVVRTFREYSPAAIELVDKSVFKTVGKEDRISRYSRTEEPFMVFCELDGTSGDGSSEVEMVGAGKVGGFEPVVISAASEVAEAWGVRNETLTLAQEIRKGPKKLVPGVEDLVVPPDRLGDLVRLLTEQFGRRGLEYISYGHAGDANLHARPLLDVAEPSGRATLTDLMEDCFESVWKMGGSMTGEHGDGMLRAEFVERQYPRTFWIMKEVKNLYDPKGVLNPGVKIP